MRYSVAGLRGNEPFDSIVNHFNSIGGDVVLMEPSYIYGRDMAESAVEHAMRAFDRKQNRSKTLLTEIIIYAACERQISKAIAKMKPRGNEYVAVVLGFDDVDIGNLDLERDDSIIDGTPEKAEIMGLTNGMGISPRDLVLENVAMLDVEKK